MARVKNGGLRAHQKLLGVLAGQEGAVTLTTLHSLIPPQTGFHWERLSTHIWNARKEGADLEVVKTGKQISGLALKNRDEFKKYLAGTVAKVEVTPATKATVEKAVAEAVPEAKAAAKKKAAPKPEKKAPVKPAMKATPVTEAAPAVERGVGGVAADFDATDDLDIPSFLRRS